MQPIRLRPATENNIGTTAFFRNRMLLNTVCQQLTYNDNSGITVLFHACSIGAEVFSFLVSAILHPCLRDRKITIDALDLEPGFIQIAEQAVYPKQILSGMTEDEKSFFEYFDESNVRPIKAIRDRVRFLPASSFSNFKTNSEYDVVFLMNAFLYVSGEIQSRTIDRIAGYNSSLLITTAFHQDIIKQDISRNGYIPVCDNITEIHDGWLDRRLPKTSQSEIIPGKIFHPWSLPPFEEIEDYEYKYCSVFKKIDVSKHDGLD